MYFKSVSLGRATARLKNGPPSTQREVDAVVLTTVAIFWGF